MRRGALAPFASLKIPNYRLFFIGHSTSLIGTWMDRVAQSWLVLQLTNSGTALGVIAALQTVPILLLGPYGGVIADRYNKRNLLILADGTMSIVALILAVLTMTHVVQLWHVYALAVVSGLCSCIESPTRQAFIHELVGEGDLRNAVSLNTTTTNVARTVGPAIGGVLIGVTGVGFCFFLNFLSFGAVIASLFKLRSRAVGTVRPRKDTNLRSGISYVLRTPELRQPLLMVAIISALAYEFPVVLPLFASRTFAGGAATFGFLTSSLGLGAICGGLLVAGWGKIGMPALVIASLCLGATMTVAAVSPTLWTEVIALFFVGAALVIVISQGNSPVQLAALPAMRGRVMAFWSVAVLGSTTVGGPIIGVICQLFGPRYGMAVGAVTCFAVAVFCRSTSDTDIAVGRRAEADPESSGR